jgi:hypothetical protein
MMIKTKKIRAKEKIDIMRLDPILISNLLHAGMPRRYGLNRVIHVNGKRLADGTVFRHMAIP